MPSPPHLIEQIHAAARPLVLAITGGGSGAIAALLEVPGASATVLEAVVPYSAAALDDWLGAAVEHYCSEGTARAMAMAAFERARELSNANPHMLCGIGATASLASNLPKRGKHRIHVAWQTAVKTSVLSCELEKGARSRVAEENVATQLIVNAIAEAHDLKSNEPELQHRGDSITRRDRVAPPAWTVLLLGEQPYVDVNSETCVLRNSPALLFPGAFNPLHSGHRRMAQIAADRLGAPVTFELSITNVDKPPLDFIEIADRVTQLAAERLLLTRAPRFVEKARIAPGCTFIVGVDTIVRIGDARYYTAGDAERDAAIAAIRDAGCRFLVFGRNLNSLFRTLSTSDVPPALRQLCDEVSERDFRDDVSSTAIRAK